MSTPLFSSYFSLLAAVRQRCYDIVLSLIMGGALVESCTAVHEAAQVSTPPLTPTTTPPHGAPLWYISL